MKICSNGGTVELTSEDERLAISEIAMCAEAQTKEGDTFFLITQRWWLHWLEYVNQDQQYINNDGSSPDYSDSGGSSSPKRPCGIDNFDLLNDMSENSVVGVELQDALVEGRDYVLLPQGVWNQLYTWYGGGPALERNVISSGMSQMELEVEVYPLRLHLYIMPKDQHSIVKISKKETVGELHRRVCVIFNFDSEKVCIWDYYGQRKHALLNDVYATLDDANIQMDQDILVEVQNMGAFGGSLDLVHENGSVEQDTSFVLAESCKSSSSAAGDVVASRDVSKCINSSLTSQIQRAASLKDLDATYNITTRSATPGLTGLQNLGNTCFMNSAIQCLVHTPEFVCYFQEDFYQEINWKNPLGMVGELALAFGELLRKLWAPGRTPVSPRTFKAKLSRFAPQFSGYNQHDSQELLAFLLDGLHEDLNRVRKKPYIKSRDADGRPDEEVADEYWANHIARNDSIIVDVCQGQYKSTLVCPICSKISVTFDPFMYLSLPLQSTYTRMMTITVFTCDGSALPVTCTVSVQKQGRCRDLIQALSSACSLKDSESLLLAQIEDHLISHFVEDPLAMLATIKDDDYLAAYKFPKLAGCSLYMQLIHLREEQDKACGTRRNSSWKSFGTPFVLPIIYEGALTCGHLQLAALRMFSPFSRNEAWKSTIASDYGSSLAGSNKSVTTVTSGEAHENSRLSYLGQKLPLCLVSQNNENIDLSTDDNVIPLSSSTTRILVYMEWSKRLLNDYDTSYLENAQEVLKSGPMMKKARSEPLSLYTCLEAFLREEPLVPEDMWHCPECKERRQASKKLDLWRLPQVLVIHLKRFSYSRSMKHKLETFVNFPIHDFNLTSYVAHKSRCGQHNYELFGLINHYGSMGSGHYTAHIKLLDENRWYTFDDNHVTPINEDDIKSSAAYVLFYRRVKTCPGYVFHKVDIGCL